MATHAVWFKKNSGAAFVRAVRTILQPIRDFSESYVDDMGVGSGDWPEHLNHIYQYLRIIREVGMTLNLSKCGFAKFEVKSVGHYIGSGVRGPDPQRLEAIANMGRTEETTWCIWLLPGIHPLFC